MNRNTFFRASAVAAAISLSSVANAQFSESFDTYTAGSAIEGQGGWQNWDICATGNQMVNVISTAQAASGANSLRMVGGNCNFCSDTTHELNGPYSAGQWTMSINTYIPNNFFGDAYFIILNTYGNCGGPYDWSAQLRYTTTGEVTVDNLNNNVIIMGDQPIIYDQWVELKMEIDLDADSVIYSYNGVEMFSAEWMGGGVAEIAALDLFPGTDDTTEFFVDDISLTAGISSGDIGTNYCMANANSTGIASSMGATGSANVATNNLTLTASDLPTFSFGFFITGPMDGFTPNPGGSSGNLCVAGGIGRYVGPGEIQNSGSNGMIELLIDNTMVPTPTGFVSIAVGETRYFQLWHRDADMMGNPTSNFTDGYEITFN